MGRRLFFPFLLLGVQLFAVAQNQRADSLTRLVAQTNDPIKKVELLNRLVAETWDFSFEKGLELAEQAYAIARRQNDVRGIAFSGTSIGMYHYFKADYPTALRFYWRALKEVKGKILGDIPAYTHIRLGNLYRVQGHFDSSRWYYDMAELSLKDQPAGSTYSSLYYNRGMLATAQSDFTAAIANIEKSLTIRTALKDSISMAECWRALGNVYKSLSDFEKAREYYQQTLAIANRYNDPELLMFCQIHIGELDFLQGDNMSAMKRYTSTLEMLKTHDFKRYHGVVLQLMGRVFDAQGEYDRAMESFLASLKVDEEINSRQTAARTRGMMAWVHIRQRHDSLAFHYANLSLQQCATLNDREGVAFAHNINGYIHYIRKEYDQALEHFQKALGIRSELGLSILVSNTLYNIARVYEGKGDLQKASTTLSQSLSIDSDKQRPALVSGYNMLASIYLKQGRLSDAEKYLKEAQAQAKLTNARLDLRNNYKMYAELAKAQRQPEKANRYYELYIQLNDSLFNTQNAERIAQLNALYELDKKEKEIQLLNTQNELSRNQLVIQRSQLRWQNAVLVGSVIGALLLMGIAFVLYRYYKEKSDSANELLALNKELQEKKEETEVQAEELKETNDQLVKLNKSLSEQQEEIQAQSEELMEANQTISSINKNLEVAVEERTGQLKEAYRELDTFFYRASHDFRRPLTTFMGLAEVANITVKDKNALELFEKVRETARNLDKMLSKLQSVSSVGASEAIFREIFFRTEIDQVYDIFKEELLARKINFFTDVNLQRPFRSYPAIIRIILVNLVENAIHFANPEQPQIDISITDPGHQVKIQIKDNGEGIKPEYQSRVFDMYFRASEKSKGNGLGLYIVRKSVERLNGAIQLESAHGAGTSITILLPQK